VVTALDVRSQGFESECDKGIYHNGNGQIFRDLDREPENLIYRNIFLDCARLARVTAEIAGTKQVVTHGGSQGGALSTACAALAPDVVKLALITFPFLSDYKRVWEMDLAVAAYDEIRTYFRKYDPRHEREDEVFTKLGYVDIQFLALRITAEVLMVTGLMDTICPPSTQFTMYNKITSKNEVIFYPDFGHEGLPGLEDIYFKRVMAASLAE
jgi:cephalosporin-C deacetylase